LKATRLQLGDKGGTTSAYDYLRRPDATVESLRKALPAESAILNDPLMAAALPQVEIEAKYAGYIEREKQTAQRMLELEGKMIPANFNFAALHELRKEARQCLEKFRPQTLGQASRLEGITPSDLAILLLYLQGKRARASA
jgi:tRNA uridine 5-carboxymethylaminomethyl modification enzyme